MRAIQKCGIVMNKRQMCCMAAKQKKSSINKNISADTDNKNIAMAIYWSREGHVITCQIRYAIC